LPRRARIVAAGFPHHVTHRGHDKGKTFFGDHDYADYLTILGQEGRRAGVEVWAYCLMPNHVHLILVPKDENGLAKAVGETSRRHAYAVNRREGKQGRLWQSRFYSVALDERHLVEAVRYVLLNPVRAKLTKSPGQWKWCSLEAHERGSDPLVTTAPLRSRIASFEKFLSAGLARDAAKKVRAATKNGRPLGDDKFVGHLSHLLGRDVATRPRGRPRAAAKVAGARTPT
jgi:putative transposase